MLYLLLITPVTVRVDLRLLHGAEAVIAPRVWGLGPDLRFKLERTEIGHRVVRVDGRGRLRPMRALQPGGPKLPLSALRLVTARITLLRLDVALGVSLGDAARTALTTGGLQSVWRALPARWRRRARLQVRPDFLGGQGALQARCMVFFRLGTLLLIAIMLLISLRRSESWNIPSAN